MRRARFRRAVSSRPTAATSSHSFTPPPSHAAAAPAGMSALGSQPPAQPGAAVSPVAGHSEHVMPLPHGGRGSQEYLDTDTASTAAEVGSMLRDSRAMSLPDCCYALQSPYTEGFDADDTHAQQSFILPRAASTGGHSTPDNPAVHTEFQCAHGSSVDHPEGASEAAKLPISEPIKTCGDVSTQETEVMHAALDESKAQNAQLRASLAAMRAEIELLQHRQLPAGTAASSQIEPAAAGASCTRHRSQEHGGSHADATPAAQPITAAEGSAAIGIGTQKCSRQAHKIWYGTPEHVQSECARAVVLRETATSPVRDSSGPFSSTRDASLRAASLHAAIMAATGGESSAMRALEGVLGSTQHAQPGCNAAVQATELPEGTRDDLRVCTVSCCELRCC